MTGALSNMTYAEPMAQTVHKPGSHAAEPSPQPAVRKGCSVSEGADCCTLGQRVSAPDVNQS